MNLPKSHTIRLRGPWSIKVSTLNHQQETIRQKSVQLPFSFSDLDLSIDSENGTEFEIELRRKFSTPTGLTSSQTVFLQISTSLENCNIFLNEADWSLSGESSGITIPVSQHLKNDHSKNELILTSRLRENHGALKEVCLVITND